MGAVLVWLGFAVWPFMCSHASYVPFLASAPSYAYCEDDVLGASNLSYLRAPADGGGGGALFRAVGGFGGGAHCDPAFDQGLPRTPDAVPPE